ncbi:unnamed protein product (macronuclear) [Paramecium tetraurelia]|uniref:Uncharacterized protein n=1 Tax=Paramecium tetraurelia TaxID=5888 RepID=A0CT29_PARTE|nr:uncharacterized protein GSPATT00038964001 [Paramecium tetraurelia]CAK73946.1 unnamed protein product [Paramecium tetraurelia]|eukprot:XP_001441343.1 hypothetical protein (macronuclear) [Paramecium tetraurelia strain d4-2]
MYCFFKTTTTTKRSFLELQPMVSQLQQHEVLAIQYAEHLRNQIMFGNFQLIPTYIQTFFNNLRPILNRQSFFHPQFEYQPIVSNSQLKSPQNSQEAFEVDYLMLLYTFCCESLCHSFEQIKNIRQAIIEDRLPNPNDVAYILEKLKAAYALIKHAQVNSNSLLPNLRNQRPQEFKEFTEKFPFRFNTYIIVMTNLIYFEKLRETNNYQNLIRRQNLCGTMVNMLIQFGNLYDDRLGQYLYYLSFYLKCLGYKCIIDRYEYQIQQNDYAEKSYTVMSQEILEISSEIKNICQIILVTRDLNEDYMDVFKIQAERWIQFSDTQVRVYSGTKRNQQIIYTNDSILLNSGHFNCLD